jgi:ABC-2 type transport system permease protein
MWFLIRFFLKNAFRSRRITWLSLLGLLPVAVGALLVFMPRLTGAELDAPILFLDVGLTLYIHILLPLLAALIGCSLVAEEVDDRTLPYILTRPVPKWLFVVSKMLAGCITVGLILGVSLFATYTVMTGAGGFGSWFGALGALIRAAGVLSLGCLAYTAFFGLLGASMIRPVLMSMVFAFGWEKIIAHMPSRVKLMTVVAYLNELYPSYRQHDSEEGIDAILGQLVRAGDVSMPAPALVLLAIFLGCTALTTLLVYKREYDIERG